MTAREIDGRRSEWRAILFLVGLALVFAMPLVVWAGRWDDVPERVDAPPLYGEMGPRSLAIGSDGRPRVAFGGDHLYYAWHDGAVWHTVVVDDAPGVGRYTSLALETDDTPHISYYDAAEGNLRYVTGAPQPDGSCAFDPPVTVDADGDVGMYSAIALYGGLPRIAYYDATRTAAKHAAMQAGGAWRIDDVDGTPESLHDPRDSGEYISLAIDADGVSHLSYYDATDATLMYAASQTSGWFTQQVTDTESWCGHYTCIAIGESNPGDGPQPHISFKKYDTEDVYLAIMNQHGNWDTWPVEHQNPAPRVTPTPDPTDGPAEPAPVPNLSAGDHTSLVIEDGIVYVIWYESYWGNLWGAWRAPDGNWEPFCEEDDVYRVPLPIDDRGDVGRYCSLAAAADGTLRVTYYDADQRRLRYAVQRGAGWESETIGQQPAQGEVLAADVDGAGNAKLVVHDPATGALTYIQQEGDEWYSERIVASGVSEGHADLVATTEGALIAYYDENTASLRVAERTASGWDHQLVDDAADVGRYCSLGVFVKYIGLGEWDRQLHIAYYDADNRDLKHAQHSDLNDDPGEWHPIMLDGDDDRNVGQYASLVLDEEGEPHISYYDEDYGDLRYAEFEGDEEGYGWTLTTLDAKFDRGKYSRIALAPDGWPCIVYYHDDSPVIDETPTPGPSPTPTIGPSPTPTPLQSRLRYAHVIAETWYTDTLCNPDDALDPYDHHQIVTRVAAIHDLVIAENADGELAPHVLYREAADGPRALAHLVDDTAPVPVWDFDTKADEFGLGSGAALAEEWGESLLSVYSLDSTLRISRTYRSESVPPVETVRDLPISLVLADPEASIPADATTWFTASARMDEYAAVALLDNGQPCVAYQDVTRRDLRYAWRDDDGVWHREIVDRDGDTGNYISLVVDPVSGQPRIAYVGSNDLRYAARESVEDVGRWSWELVEGAEDAAYVSLALDAGGSPVIAFHSLADSSLHYAVVEGDWRVKDIPVASDLTTGLYAALALDQAGNLHIAHYAEPSCDLRYCSLQATGWVTAIVQADGFAGEYCDIALDAFGQPHISARGNGTLLYATKEGGGWSVEIGLIEDAPPEVDNDTAIAIADDGTIHIIYREEDTAELKHLEHLPGEDDWEEPKSVDWRGDVGRHASLVVGGGDQGLWAAYANASSGDILAIHYDPVEPTPEPTITVTPSPSATPSVSPTPGPTSTPVVVLNLPLVLRGE